MSVYRIDADYSKKGPLADSERELPCRLQIATSDAFIQLELGREDYDDLMGVVSSAAQESTPGECTVNGDTLAIGPAPPQADDSWEVEIVQGGSLSEMQCKFMLLDNEIEGFDRLLRSVHPDHDVDEATDPNLEVHQ